MCTVKPGVPLNTDARDMAVGRHSVQFIGWESNRNQHMKRTQDRCFFLRLGVICEWYKDPPRKMECSTPRQVVAYRAVSVTDSFVKRTKSGADTSHLHGLL